MASEVRLIGCRNCDAYDCEGCNVYTLSEMLRCGEFDCMMDDHHTIVLTPETLRPKGRWVMTTYTTTSKRGREISNTKFACPECGYSNGRKQSNFCPNCGADMRGGAE